MGSEKSLNSVINFRYWVTPWVLLPVIAGVFKRQLASLTPLAVWGLLDSKKGDDFGIEAFFEKLSCVIQLTGPNQAKRMNVKHSVIGCY